QANESFGVTLDLLREGKERVLDHHRRRGENRVIASSGDHVSPPKPGGPGTPADERVTGRAKSQEPKANNQLPTADCSPNVMYFQTGQGSAPSAEAHHGVAQLTLEARAYGVARVFQPFLINSVVGFIGPEYLYDERQIIRAGLEDHFMGKLLG